MNVFLRADEIINKRSEEKEREYGPIDECLTRTAVIASEMCAKQLTVDDVYKVLIALKLSRLAHSHKEDTILDAIAYLGAFNNLKNNNKTNGKAKTK